MPIESTESLPVDEVYTWLVDRMLELFSAAQTAETYISPHALCEIVGTYKILYLTRDSKLEMWSHGWNELVQSEAASELAEDITRRLYPTRDMYQVRRLATTRIGRNRKKSTKD